MLVQYQPKSHGIATVFKDYGVYYRVCCVVSCGINHNSKPFVFLASSDIILSVESLLTEMNALLDTKEISVLSARTLNCMFFMALG